MYYPKYNLAAFTLELPLGLLLLHYVRLGRLRARVAVGDLVVVILRATRSDGRRTKELFLHRSDGLGYKLLRRSLKHRRRPVGDLEGRQSFDRRIVAHGFAVLSRRLAAVYCGRRTMAH